MNARKIQWLWLTAACAVASGCTVDTRVGAFTSQGWVTVGYEAWQSAACPPSKIDFTALTHLAVRGFETRPGGGLGLGPDLPQTLALDLAERAHAAGRKVLMGIGGYGDAEFAGAVSSTHRAAFVASILVMLDELHYDGLDLHLGYAAGEDLVALVEALRSARPALVLTFSASWGQGAEALSAQLAPTVDQINVFCAEMALARADWVSWHFSPLDGAGPGHPSSVSAIAGSYADAGIPMSKLGLGMSFTGQAWTLPVTGPLQEIGESTIAAVPTYAEIMQDFYYVPEVNRGFSDGASGDGAGAEMAWLSFSAGYTPPGYGAAVSWVSYEDPASIAAKGAWAREKGLGGAAVWRIAEGVTDQSSGENPMLDAVKDAFLP